jgi:2-polyprenyl-6-hydroxyphenyl methylase/3-demethylubiquinone-9 3-methyltransferase
MNKKLLNNQEFRHFSAIAQEWWLPNGKFGILHKILPVRISYILDNINLKKVKNIEILDLGCGGGLTCEPLARLGANVTGVDFVKENIDVAKKHAFNSNLKIKYIHSDLYFFNTRKKYDIILLLEVLEHLDDWGDLIKKISKNLKPNGKLIISTINKTIFSKFFGIFFAEHILKWIPKNTHHYDKLINPKELKKTLIKNNFKIKNLVGMNYNLLSREWYLDDNFKEINYFCAAQLNKN